MAGSVHADSAMTLTLNDDLTVLVSIDSGEVLDQKTREIVTSDEIRDVYTEDMMAVFGSAEGMTASAGDTFTLSFTADLVVPEGEGYAIRELDFGGRIAGMSVLRVVLPDGYRFAGSSQGPDAIEGGTLTWKNAAGIPEVVFEKEERAVPVAAIVVLTPDAGGKSTTLGFARGVVERLAR